MRSAIRKGKAQVEMEAADRRHFASTIAGCEFLRKNLDPSESAAITSAEIAASALRKLLERFPAKDKAAVSSHSEGSADAI